MISPPAGIFSHSFVNVQSLRAARASPAGHSSVRRAARGVVAKAMCAFQRPWQHGAASPGDGSGPSGVVVALSVWWKKLARDGKNATN